MNRAKICDGRKKGQDGLDGGQQEVGDTRPQAPVDQDEGEDQSGEDKDECSVCLKGPLCCMNFRL